MVGVINNNKMGVKHRLHKRIQKLITKKQFKDCIPLFDSACVLKEGNAKTHALTIFRKEPLITENKSCNVDIVLIKNDKVKVIIEIEESGINPDKICGKFFTSFLSKFFCDYKNNKKPYELDESVLFIQILKINTQKEHTVKKWENLKHTIQEFVSITKNNKAFKIKKYELFYGNQKEFINKSYGKGKELIETIKEFLEEK